MPGPPVGGGYADALDVRLGSLTSQFVVISAMKGCHEGHLAEVGFGVLLSVSDSIYRPALTARGTPVVFRNGTFFGV